MIRTSRATLSLLSSAALLSACAVPREPIAPAPAREPPAAVLALEQGVSTYENGRYEVAALWLDEALRLGLEADGAKRAHKLRAFIDCIAARMDECKRHFREIMRLDPDFELVRAEAGHPMWGPAFREVRAEFSLPPTQPAAR